MKERLSKEDWWTHVYLWFELEVDEYLESCQEQDTPETRASAEGVLNDLRVLALSPSSSFAGGNHEPSTP